MSRQRTPGSNVTGVILAAGPSTRFGGEEPKQLARFDGEPLVRRAARTALASRLRQILVVVGHEAPTVAAVLAGLAVELVDNPSYREGRSSSVRAALDRIDPAAEAALFVPVDQPLLTAAILDRLIEAHAETRGPVVVPTHRGARRAPVLIDRSLFPQLARVIGDEGGRQLFARLGSRVVELELDDRRALEDVDTLADLQRLRG